MLRELERFETEFQLLEDPPATSSSYALKCKFKLLSTPNDLLLFKVSFNWICLEHVIRSLATKDFNVHVILLFHNFIPGKTQRN